MGVDSRLRGNDEILLKRLRGYDLALLRRLRGNDEAWVKQDSRDAYPSAPVIPAKAGIHPNAEHP